MRWLGLFLAMPLLAHDPVTTRLTYTRDISRLINRRCIACHGATATVPLASYEQARPWAKAIRDQVMTRRMPPWGAVPGFGPDLQGDPSLTATEIDTAIRWVEGGAPEGDAALLPKTTPPTPKPPPLLRGPLMEVGCEWRAQSSFMLLGIRPERAANMRVTLTRPDGSVVPILWLPQGLFKEPDFVFAKPLAIPRGSVLRVQAEGNTSAEVLTPSGKTGIRVPAMAALALSPANAWLRLPKREIQKLRWGCPSQ